MDEKFQLVQELLDKNKKLRVYKACEQAGVTIQQWYAYHKEDTVRVALEMAATKTEAALELAECDGGESLRLLPSIIRDLYKLHFKK